MGYIKLTTEIPGPKSREVLARHERFVARALALGFPAAISRAKGALLTDVDGNQFIDLAGGVGVLNVGHSDPEVVGAAREQLERFVHTDYTVAPYALYSELAERLARLVPGGEKAAFFNAGAEAVENAIKMARAYTGRKAVISFEGGFHGRTWMALALTSKTSPYKQGFLPLAGEVYRVPYAYPYRPPVRLEDGQSFGEACTDLLEQTFSNYVASDDVAALIVEPVLGEGGFVVPPNDYLPALKRKCEERGIVFITDEVQTGFGRTGPLFACGCAAVSPDLLCLSKGITGGFLPLGVTAATEEIFDAFRSDDRRRTFFHGHSYTANPLACAAARASLRLLDDDCARRRAAIETAHHQGLARIGAHPRVSNARVLGTVAAFDLDAEAGYLDPVGRRLAAFARREGVLLRPLGSVVYLMPPYCTTAGEVDNVYAVVERFLESA